MGKLISLNQKAFFKNKWIAKNTMSAQEVLYKISMYKKKNGLVTLKVALKKSL